MARGRVLFLIGIGVTFVPSVAAAAEPTVCIVPLGEHDEGLLPAVERGVEHVYGLDVRILPARPLPKAAWYQPRHRYRAEKLLAHLDTEVVPRSGCDIAMGFTGVDISSTKKHHADWGMLGYAWIGGPSGVVSTYRMRRRVSRRRLAMRAVKVVNHELGHVLGVPHLRTRGCLMQDKAGTVRTVDRETGLLCDEERRSIEQRHELTLPARTRIDWRAILG